MYCRTPAREPERREGRDGEILADGRAGRGARRVPATAWRLWLHAGIRHSRDVGRCPRAAHLWRHQRDHEGTDREGAVSSEVGTHTAPFEPGVSHPRTPVEYLRNDEGRARHPAPTAGRSASGTRQGFTVHAHRLSSLWRDPIMAQAGLTGDEAAPLSSFRKYSAGVWGCKTPTPRSARGTDA